MVQKTNVEYLELRTQPFDRKISQSFVSNDGRDYCCALPLDVISIKKWLPHNRGVGMLCS
jgi:hypothetical protein